MVCFSTRKHLQPDSDPVVQLGQMGRGEWHQMAEGSSLPPFHKGGLRLPPGLRAPKMTSPAGLGEVPTAARPRGLARSLSPPPRHPQHPGRAAGNCTPKRTGAGRAAKPVRLTAFKEGKRAKSAKPQNRLRKVLEQQAGGRNKGV